MAIKIGDKKIAKIKKGSTEVKEVATGSTRTFISSTEIPTLSFVSKSQTKITLRILNNDSDNLTDIQIDYNGQSFTQGSLSIPSGQNQDFTITGLDPNTNYDFTAIADANGKGFSEQSNTINQSTLAMQTPDITFVSRTVTSLNYTFKNNNDEPANIRTTITSGSSASNVTASSTISVSDLDADTTSGSISFTGLSENTTYSIGARSEIGGHLSNQSSATNTTLDITYSISANDTSINESSDRDTTFNISTTNFGSGTLY